MNNKLKKISFLTLFLINTIFVFSQKVGDHVKGDILIKLNQTSVNNWITKNQTFRGSNTNVTYKEVISKSLNVHLITFNHNLINENDFLKEIKKDSDIETAQFNHYIKMRSTIPDDASFSQQWQYINTGQSGGTIGADIDIDLAWDITTGGTSASGDEIVACVIDEGINQTHPDIIDNLWTNNVEIPGNGIDEDNNGFIDDIIGWNFQTNSNNVNVGGSHGTPVAGIVGAKGNNGIGVAGVNWDIKLMFLVHGNITVESIVLAAYDYPMQMRKKYNETDGAEGAFVVSTNASWGIDFGQPEDYPLWCEFYNELGSHGILSAAATINGNQNVDVIGDLPTGCDSDYLITVTNMDHNDQKVTNAGYGLTTIDLGAFGEGTYTTSGSGYGGFGGTSGATPHVTGTIALLYSAPCLNFIDYAKTNPAEAALLVKNYILDGVDPNASLAGITVTGGRLNVNNALQLLMDNCSSLSVSTQESFNSLTSYPNPFEDKLTLDFNQIDIKTVKSIKIHNLLGQLVYQIDKNRFNQNKINLELNNLKTGVYILKIDTQNGKRISRKLVKK